MVLSESLCTQSAFCRNCARFACSVPLITCLPSMTPARASEGSDSRDKTLGRQTIMSTSLDGTDSPLATDPKILHWARGHSPHRVHQLAP